MSGLAVPKPDVRIMLCVNDWQNGTPQGFVQDVHLEDEYECELASPYWREGPRFYRDGKRVRLGRRFFPILEYRHWVGNWCWDQITVSRDVALKILAYLKERGYTMEAGLVENPLLEEAGWPRENG